MSCTRYKPTKIFQAASIAAEVGKAILETEIASEEVSLYNSQQEAQLS